MHWATPVVDRTASMRPRTFDSLSPRRRSQNVTRVPRLHMESAFAYWPLWRLRVGRSLLTMPTTNQIAISTANPRKTMVSKG